LSDPQSGSYEICPVCFWEDDPVQNEDPAFVGGANRACLFDARLNYIRFGACEESSVGNVRPPMPSEYPPVPVLYGLEEEQAAPLRRGLKVQILAIIRSMRAGSVGIIIGSTHISPLVHRIDQPELEDALLPFVGVASEVDDLPIGRERDLWDRNALTIKDRQFADYESRLKGPMLATCGAVETLLIADLTASHLR
jgi:hypothetical protein